MSHILNRVIGGACLTVLFSCTAATLRAADDSIIAMGTVDASAASFFNSANSVGGALSITDNGTGDLDIVIDAVGAFAGAMEEDFLVEITRLGSDSDNFAYGVATNVTADQLVVTTRGVDMEGNGDQDNSNASNTDFGFVIRQMNANSTIGAGSGSLIGLGRVNSTGTLASGFGVNGIAVTSVQNNTGDYTVTLEKSGFFAGAAVEDFVVMATVRGSGTDDDIPTLNDVVITDDSVELNILVFDTQIGGAETAGEADNDDFFFTVYQIPGSTVGGTPESALLIAGANVNSAGTLAKGATSLPGGVVTSTDTVVGVYEVDVVAAGAFAGKTASQYVALATIADPNVEDHIIQPLVTVINDSTLRIGIRITDVEVMGDTVGDPADDSFTVVLYDADPDFLTDMHIGQKRNLTKMKGNNRYNNSGGGQGIKVELPPTGRKRYFFAVQNDGASLDNFGIKEKGAGSIVKSKYFRLTGGRANVTAKVKRGREVATGVSPDQAVIFQAQPKYRNADSARNRKIKLRGTSLLSGSTDTVKAKVVLDD